MFRTIALSITMLSLTLTVYAQNNSNQEREKTRQSPPVRTVATEGGPTGTITVDEDGKIVLGKFKFSAAYSYFERDAVSDDISDAPLTFNVGLNDHIPLFFKTTEYRDSKIDTPTLSSFYLTTPYPFLSAATVPMPSAPASISTTSGPKMSDDIMYLISEPTALRKDVGSAIIARWWAVAVVDNFQQPDQSQFNKEPRTWTRPSYSTVSNPKTHLRLGLYEFDSDVSDKDKERVRVFMKKAPEAIKTVCNKHGETSKNCIDFKAAFEVFGPEGQKNGIIIKTGSVQDPDAAAETDVLTCREYMKRTPDNPSGQRTILTFTKDAMNSDELPMMFWHEGSHAADGQKWRASGCQKKHNPFVYFTEYKAYSVASLAASVFRPRKPYEFVLPGKGHRGRNLYLPEILRFYDPKLKREEQPSATDANIKKFLARPKDAGGHYGVTVAFPGPHAF